MVQGDIFPALLTRFGDLLAIPLREISNIQVWPLVWKQEFVTVIPKKTVPQCLGDLTNISCTMLPSKIYGSHVLNWLQEEVSMKNNQY